MAQLLSTTVSAAPQKGAYPQMMNITQEFDSPVYVTDDFAVEFGGNTPGQPGAMFAMPVQFVPTQLNYQMPISPFSSGRLGVLRYNGQINDVFGDPVNLKIGQDYDIYNVDLYPYFKNPVLDTPWGSVIPNSAICPNNTNPGFSLKFGPFTRPVNIEQYAYAAGRFYLWVNYTWKPDLTDQGIPFEWAPPFFYSWSMFGEEITNTWIDIPPVDTPTVRYNISSSGNTDQWDTCGWIEAHPKWRGKLQIWGFCSDVFAEAGVPWQFPAVADPTGNLSPEAVFGFNAANVPLQFYIEKPFIYNR